MSDEIYVLYQSLILGNVDYTMDRDGDMIMYQSLILGNVETTAEMKIEISNVSIPNIR